MNQWDILSGNPPRLSRLLQLVRSSCHLHDPFTSRQDTLLKVGSVSTAKAWGDVGGKVYKEAEDPWAFCFCKHTQQTHTQRHKFIIQPYQTTSSQVSCTRIINPTLLALCRKESFVHTSCQRRQFKVPTLTASNSTQQLTVLYRTDSVAAMSSQSTNGRSDADRAAQAKVTDWERHFDKVHEEAEEDQKERKAKEKSASAGKDAGTNGEQKAAGGKTVAKR